MAISLDGTADIGQALHLAGPTPTIVLAQGSHTALAVELNVAMALNPAAQAAYLAIYGEAWEPLPLNGCLVGSDAARMERSVLATVR